MIVDILVRSQATPMRSLAKTVSWRMLGSLDTMSISWIITGNLVWAGSIASVEVFTKFVLYYLHERGWEHVKWGLRFPKREDSEPAPEAVIDVIPLPERENLPDKAA